ncbi:MAG: hypothetical protein JW787_15580 [Sedimentisphaerales bacterium]|nr:hypothetical protein [Sedimentisphaerales bacterium]
MKSPIIKFAAAALILVVIILGMERFGINSSSVAWGDISEHFTSVPFFNLTIYTKENSSSKISKMQIWKSEDSRVRVESENATSFIDLKGTVNKIITFDQNSKSSVQIEGVSFSQSANAPNMSLMVILWDMMNTEGQFSLDTLIKNFPSNVNGITLVTAAETAASKEIILFEAKSLTTPEHLTIWALRESKLPLLMQFRDPRSGDFGDFIFNYSQKMDPSFFDSESFKK